MRRQPKPVQYATLGLFCILYSYFVLLPVREAAVLAYGTKQLPALFMASLVLTLAVSPLTAAATSMQPAGRGHRLVMQCFVIVTLGLYAMTVLGSEAPAVPDGSGQSARTPTQPRVSLQVASVLFVTVPLVNVVATSTMWSLCAACFTPTVATQYYGFLSAGATAGQLLGSATALLWTKVLKAAGGPPAPLLGAAALMLGAAHSMQRMVSSSQTSSPRSLTPTDSSHHTTATCSKSGSPWLSGPQGTVRGTMQAVRLRLTHTHRVVQDILRSPYLCLIATHIGMSAMVSSLVYFQRALVVTSALHDSKARMTFFATLNSISASLILVLQLLATAALIKQLGVQLALCVTPALSALGFLLMAWQPTPTMVAGVEVVRKLIMYSLGKPTREVLFTVLSKEELSSKVVLDALICRVGDAVAAQVYQCLDVQLGLGPRAVALAGCGVCCVWLAVAVKLGQVFHRRDAHIHRPVPGADTHVA